MNPQQPNGPYPPPPASNPYDFIMSANKPPKATIVPGGSNSFIMKLVLIIGGAIILVVVTVVVVNVIFGSKTNVSDLTTITETQQEIARVANQNTQISDPTILGAAISARLTVLTQQQLLLTYLNTHGVKVSAKQLALKKDATTDRQLVQAQATSTVDITFTQILRQQLQDYATSLKTAYTNAKTTNTKERALLATDYSQTQMLLRQLPAPQTPTSP
jgi:hypothetical protein